MNWYVEGAGGAVVSERAGDDAVNPASVVKVATSLWALERLGSEFRFETRFFARGQVLPQQGEVKGDVVVQGGGDPDFHFENAFLVAHALNQAGIRRVSGALIVSRTFWMGWENGSSGRNSDPIRRGLAMAGRLRQAWDPRRWTSAERAAWRSFAHRRGLDVGAPPRVEVAGGLGVDGERRQGELLMVHRSAPLVDILKRFNAYSNNDIERLGEILGPPEELAGLIAARCRVPPRQVRLETVSGLGSNALTPRGVVALLKEFRSTCDRLGLKVADVLPQAGCDPGTVTRFFPRLSSSEAAAALVGKTGTLIATDGGVSVLAGYLSTAAGELVFCAAVPGAGGRLLTARRAEEQWVLELLASQGGARPLPCGSPVRAPDENAAVIRVF
jgi:D-alanyl-D-alanine carboxypeptidase/D-alanyl-D-alanine-endopeptidase (penicillin-binding protein 4)